MKKLSYFEHSRNVKWLSYSSSFCRFRYFCSHSKFFIRRICVALVDNEFVHSKDQISVQSLLQKTNLSETVEIISNIKNSIEKHSKFYSTKQCKKSSIASFIAATQ